MAFGLFSLQVDTVGDQLWPKLNTLFGSASLFQESAERWLAQPARASGGSSGARLAVALAFVL